MARIEGVPQSEAGPVVKLVYRFMRRGMTKMTGRDPARGSGIEPVEMWAHQPKMLSGMGKFAGAARKGKSVDERIKYLIELKGSQMIGCEYCVDLGSQICRNSGFSDEELLALPRYRSSDLFTEREKLALDYTVAVMRTPVEVTDELFARMREQLHRGAAGGDDRAADRGQPQPLQRGVQDRLGRLLGGHGLRPARSPRGHRRWPRPPEATSASSRRRPGPRDVGPEPAVAADDVEVDRDAGPTGVLVDVLEQERGDVLAPHRSRVGGREGLGEQAVVQGGVELRGLRQRVGDEDPAGQVQRVGGAHHVGDLPRRGDRVVDRVAAVGQPERGEPIGAEDEHGHAQRLQPLQRGGDVEDRLDPGRHHRDAAAPEDAEVGRLVEGRAGVAVHAADPAGGEHADAGLRGEQRGRRDGRCRRSRPGPWPPGGRGR